MRRKARQATKAENRPRFWGRHAVAAALANPDRDIVRIWATREAAAAFDFGAIPVTFADVADLGRMVPRDSPHQGVVAEVERLGDVLLPPRGGGRGGGAAGRRPPRLSARPRRGPKAAGRARPGHRPAQCRRDP